MTTADVRGLSTRVLIESPPLPADVRGLSTRVLVRAPLEPADVRGLSVRMLVSTQDEFPLQPGQYVKGPDGEWYPMALFPWVSS